MKIKLSFSVLLITAFLLVMSSDSKATAKPWLTRVDRTLLEPATSQTREFIVYMAEQADLSAAVERPTKLAKGLYVYDTLTAFAGASQRPIIRMLESAGATYRQYWIANFIWVRGDVELIEKLASRTEVGYIFANSQIRTDPFEVAPRVTEAPLGLAWNIELVNADDLWALGIEGNGVIIAGQDTGYDWDHPALKNQYRGWDGISADHNYNWHDAIHTPGSVCGADSPEPCDDLGHGTHTMGTMVGDDGGSNQVGMAPGARWIGCRNMDRGFGTPTTYSECFQWFLAPTDLNGQNPDPSRAPHVINNSWACPDFEGCTDPYILEQVVKNVRQAGIAVVAAAGNSGSSTTCNTIDAPPALYEASFTVGATDSFDNIFSSSSRGPVLKGSQYILKPNITAPGVNVVSTVPNGGYAAATGTSMAAPHVAGLIALLIDANPVLADNIEILEGLIEHSAAGLISSQDCPPYPGNQVPNAVFGYGRIDALAAYQLLLNAVHYFPMIPRP